MSEDNRVLLELAERCEKATGTDVSLNLAIAIAVGAVDQRTTFTPRGGFGYVDRNQWAVSRVPAYTTSLDAAMTLVPDDHAWEVIGRHRWINSSGSFATCGPLEGHEDADSKADAATPALALTAAAIRARARASS